MRHLQTHRSIQFSAVLASGVILLGCNDPVGSDTPYTVVAVSPTVLAGTAGRALPETLVVEVRDAEGKPVPEAHVRWSLPNGGRLVVQQAAAEDRLLGTSDARGRNYAVWTLALPEGAQVARAAAGIGEPTAEFTATASVLRAKQVTVGSGYACAILMDDRPVCWGANADGQLGTGDSTGATLELATRVAGLPQALEIRATNVGLTCARDMAGDVWCWGNSVTGATGPGATEPDQLTPVRVPGAEGANGVAPSANFYYGFTCASFPGAAVRCWGDNRFGQLGTGDFVSSVSPREVVSSTGLSNLAVGGERTCALDADGEVWCWGRADRGELSPLPNGLYPTPVQPVPGHKYISLAAGAYAVCGLQFGGMVTCFGDDFGSFGRRGWPQLGLGDSPVGPELPEAMATIVSDGWNATYGRSRYGLGYVWGEPGCCDVFVIPPAMMTPSIRVIDIAASSYMYCVLGETGGVYCGRPNWWYWGEAESLAGIPDSVAS